VRLCCVHGRKQAREDKMDLGSLIMWFARLVGRQTMFEGLFGMRVVVVVEEGSIE